MCLDEERGGWTGPGNISISPKDGNRGERLYANAFWKSSKFVWIDGGGCPLPNPSPARVRIGCWMVFSMTLVLKINARKNTHTQTHRLTDKRHDMHVGNIFLDNNKEQEQARDGLQMRHGEGPRIGDV